MGKNVNEPRQCGLQSAVSSMGVVVCDETRTGVFTQSGFELKWAKDGKACLDEGVPVEMPWMVPSVDF